MVYIKILDVLVVKIKSTKDEHACYITFL